MKEFNIFQVVVLGVSIFFIVFAVLLFSGIIPGVGGGAKKEFLGTVSVWGALPEAPIRQILSDTLAGEETVKISYTEFPAEDFDRELVEALAAGKGPDVAILPHDLILRHEDKAYIIPRGTVSERDFKNTFIEEAELYLTPSGAVALPFTVDPLIMYWNRDLFSAAGISLPPTAWEEFPALVEKLTKRDLGGNITQSAVALGEYGNVSHAKDIVATFIMQAGNPIVARSAEGALLSVIAERASGVAPSPAATALRFYTEFANPSRKAYSWNRARPLSRDAFTAGTLAIYFGYASELSEIRRKNPNLNFDAAPVPSAREGGRRVAHARMAGLSIMKSSRNIPAAFRAVSLLSGGAVAAAAADAFGLPPVRRDLLTQKPADAFAEVFYESAAIARGWLDPSPARTDTIFGAMVGDILSGKRTAEDAVSAAEGEIARLLK